jgi:Na+-translocating ferredoxin:NAD+ oxidoreductase RnfG subunit
MIKAAQYSWFKLVSAGLIIGVFTGIGMAMVGLVYQPTVQRILDHQGEVAQQAFSRLFEAELYDNHPDDEIESRGSDRWKYLDVYRFYAKKDRIM